MKRALVSLALSIASAGSLGALSSTGEPGGVAASDGGAAQGSASSCTKVRAYARPTAYGFSHIVALTNGCARTVSCEVSTDVNPTPAHAIIEPTKTEEIMTFLESPASVFKARVDCKYAK